MPKTILSELSTPYVEKIFHEFLKIEKERNEASNEWQERLRSDKDAPKNYALARAELLYKLINDEICSIVQSEFLELKSKLMK